MALLLAAATVVTCGDSPTGQPRLGHVALQPVFSSIVLSNQFSGLVVDEARITVVRPPNDTVARRTFPFSPDSAEIDAQVDVTVNGASETFDATIELLAGGQVVFTGTQPVTVVAGAGASHTPAEIPMAFVGPGSSIAALAITPASGGLTFGDSLQFLVAATDSQAQPVTSFYVSWSSRAAAHAINAQGLLRAGAARGAFYVVARTPTGIADSVRVFVTPVPSAVAVQSGSGQSATAGTALAQPLVARVTAADAGPVAGVTVTFAAASGGGSVAPVTATTDSLGLASTTATLGSSTGTQSFTATVSGLSPATFTATATPQGGVPVSVQIATGDGQSATVNQSVAIAPRVRVRDFFGNGVPGVQVVFGVASGGGSATALTDTTDASGFAEVGSWTLGPNPGANTMTAALPGFPFITGVTFTATGLAVTSGIDSIKVTPALDTLTALTETVGLGVQAWDTLGNVAAGSYTWVSRAPGVATVNAAGLVTAVANGSTWVVVTEAGGERDSARIVVDQRVASIAVSPANRTIYLTRNYTFTATATDGLGNPMPGVTNFTWTSTAPAVASVDTAGFVTAVGLGGAQIRASSGAVMGVANVSVITPITRIAVVIDTVGAAVNDTFTMTSLGLTRRYRALAYDTLDVLMSGVSFSWLSTNGSVAVMNTPSGDTASVTSAANGLTHVRATAQGFMANPGAVLTVSQVLASIELTPPAANPTATIAINGTLALTARGKDANNRYIAGGSFTFASDTPAVATVSAAGVVTGVANGTTNVRASSGAITSNAVLVTVGGAVPAIISFGRDTLSVGRGSSTSIPILLSRPHASDLTVNLAVADTVAYWSTASVTIPAGATSVNATLNGRNAGTTSVTATDGSAAGYAGATAVLKVTANMNLQSGGYAINATDIVTTQVRLSDPSPAGGTYVTFSYGTAGIAAISPDPAFIPAGQLAADIQIRGLAAGTTSITPVATGVNGASSSFTAYAPVLTLNRSSLLLGLGQFETNTYVYTPTNTNVAVPVTITSSDTSVATAVPSVTIPGGSYYAYFNVDARSTGTTMFTVTAPGWAPDSFPVTISSPRLGLSGGGSLFITSPATNVTVYAEDSTATAHYRINSLAVQLTSRDTTVMRVLDSVVTIGAGQYYNGSGRVIPGGMGGSTWIVATAGGHRPDSVQYTVQGPPLSFSWSNNRIGAGQEDYNLYVSTPNNVASPLTVAIANSDSSIAGLPDSVTIPAGTYYVYFTVRGKVPGTATFIASAPGYRPDTASYVVTTPRVTISGGGTINNFSPTSGFTVYATDSVGTAHYRSAPLALTLRSTDTTVLRTDTVATIGAGQYYTVTAPTRTPVGVGTARIVVTAPGHGADSTSYTVITPKLNISFGTYRIGRRQHRTATDFYVYTPDTRTVAVPVTLTQTNPAVESLTTTTPDIPANLWYGYFGLYGRTTGVDTIIATASGYLPDTAYVTVTTPRLTAGGIPGSLTTTNPPFGTTVYIADSVGNSHYTSDTLTVEVTSSDTTVIRPAQRYLRIPIGAYYGNLNVNVIGPGSASLTFSDSAGTGYLPATTNTVTVTGPSLQLANGSSVLGMRQRGGVNSSYVYVPNNVASDLVVNLVSTDPRVATVPASVTVPAGSYYAYFEVTAQDTVGTIQIQATALGYNPAAMNVQVTAPRFVVSTSSSVYTTSAPTTITVYAADANGNYHYTTEDVTVTLVASAPSVAIVDSLTVTIPAGQYYTQAARWAPGQVGTSALTASDQRSVYYKYADGSQNVAVLTPPLTLASMPGTLGIGQFADYAYAYTPHNAAAPISVTFSHAGTARTATFDNGTSTPNSGVTIPAGNYYEYFRIAGTVAGTDTLIATAGSPAHIPDTAYTVVGQGRVDPIGGWPTSLVVGDSVAVTLYTRDPNQNQRGVLAATTFTLAPSSHLEFRSGGAVITQVTVPAGASQVTFYLKAIASGTGSATIAATNYALYSNTVTVP